MPRTYDMTKRSRQAAETRSGILDATENLLMEKPLSQIQLQEIAEKAGTTVQTVIRHMGSRDGCLKEVAKKVEKRVHLQRRMRDPKELDKALQDLIDHYELEGRLVLNLLKQEQMGDPDAAEFTKQGRVFHRHWVEKCFGLESDESNGVVVDALVAATDIYTWKLLRLDLGRSQTETYRVMMLTVNQIIQKK